MKKLLIILISVILVSCNTSVDNENNNLANKEKQNIELDNKKNQTEEESNDEIENENVEVEEEAEEEAEDEDQKDEELHSSRFIDFSKTKEEILTELELLKVIYAEEENSKYLIIFEEATIIAGMEDAGYHSVSLYDSVIYDLEEKSMIFHINEEEDLESESDDLLMIDVDYLVKIIFSDNGFVYYHKFDTAEEIRSEWFFQKKVN